MLTRPTHLTDAQWQPLAIQLTRITQVLKTEKIFCFGMRTQTNTMFSAFDGTLPDRQIMHYDLLIVTAGREQRKDNEIQDIVNAAQDPCVVLHAIAHRLYSVNQALTGQNPFFTTVCQQGFILYDSQQTSLSIAAEPRVFHLQRENAVAWHRWYRLGERFLQSAADHYQRQWTDLCVFMLHQAVEHFSTGLILARLGYRPSTHKLSRLMALIENFSTIGTTIFPRNTQEEATLFEIVSNAYSDARYQESYQIAAAQATILMTRVTRFHDLGLALLQKPIQKEPVTTDTPISA